jgi:hypothetical protein
MALLRRIIASNLAAVLRHISPIGISGPGRVRELSRQFPRGVQRGILESQTTKGRSLLASGEQHVYRVLDNGGCLEYIFFDRGLKNTGLLTENIEPFFYGQANCRCEGLQVDSMGEVNASQRACLTYNSSQDGVGGAQFFDMLGSQGFMIEQNSSLMFPLSALSTLITEVGQRQKLNQARFVLGSRCSPRDRISLAKKSVMSVLLQGGSKSVSPFTHRDSFSNRLWKHAITIAVTLPLNHFLGSISVQT